jgi:uncharacterized glyoxalase superfamily protein PhnB
VADLGAWVFTGSVHDEQPVFDQFNLVVTNMSATIDFYRLLGLTIPDTDPEWTAHHRSVEMGGGVHFDFDSQAFAREWDAGWTGGPKSGVLGFHVGSRDAVDRVYRRLTEAGYESEQPPVDAFFGSRYAIVRDPDGNPVGIMSPKSAEFRGSAPDSANFQ